uniref:USP domain-containing protein n=1 Tax=Malurus cyaneus samueli TaxID=2593467 RepID=A0A8C5X2Z6_9PASS
FFVPERSDDTAEGMALPQRIIFPPEKICMDWQQRQRPGAGLFNLGNTCYINVILQCLTYTPPLANYLLSYEHSQSCQQQGFCMMCIMEAHVRKVLCSSASAILPGAVLRDLKFIGEGFEYGRQENAYEFLRCTLSAMQRACLSGWSNLDTSSQETTIVHQIFGGFMKSRVTCLSCQAVVDSYKAFLDVSLDIRVRDLQLSAFQHLAMCLVSRCKKKVAASKRVTVHRAPRVLTLCLERADQWTGTKINKFVEYPEYLDLRPYMSDTAGQPLLCSLYAIVVHSGDTCLEGHFFCYTRASNGMWYKMDDESVDRSHVQKTFPFPVLAVGLFISEQAGSPVPQSLPGRIKVMHGQRNSARERARSRSPHWGSDLCRWIVNSTNYDNLTGKKRKRTNPLGHNHTPRDDTAPGLSNRICQQALVPSLAWMQTLPIQRELGRSSWQDYDLWRLWRSRSLTSP